MTNQFLPISAEAMSSLLALFSKRLAQTLPGAELCAAEKAADPETLILELAHPRASEAGPLQVALPASPYAEWPRDSLLALLAEMLRNCELELNLKHQEAHYEAYLQEVRSIKEKLLPQPEHRIPGLEYAVHYNSNVGGGGDYFDIVDLRAARQRAGDPEPGLFWGAGLFDVSGHGPGSAVEVAMIDAILRTYKPGQGNGPGDVLTYLNKHFFTRQRRGGFVTGTLCTFHDRTGEFLYANAGHLPMLVKRLDGSVTVLDDHEGIPVGIDEETEWTTNSIRLHSGELVMMLTDGITEARTHEQRQFGFERTLDWLQAQPVAPADALLASFITEFGLAVDEDSEQDDQTLVVLQLTH